jgi:hypothetical protein
VLLETGIGQVTDQLIVRNLPCATAIRESFGYEIAALPAIAALGRNTNWGTHIESRGSFDSRQGATGMHHRARSRSHPFLAKGF